ncbi:MAG: hypothetical protein KDC08_01210 [Actinobacteria bacterium]|nr:hypothetical protein [Actinomycetota bacterium]
MADETYDLIVQPALAGFDMVVERADQIRGIEDTITAEMVERIQQSDLCVVDLTGNNPNVMYECGRRHETGKPVVMITRDERLPFDVVTHPVIRYSTDCSPQDLVAVHRRIREEVLHYTESGFETLGAKTLDDLSRDLLALSNKVDLILRRTAADKPTHVPEQSTQAKELVRRLGGAIPAINWALTQEEPSLLDALLPLAPNKSSVNYVMAGLVQGTYIGSRAAFESLHETVATGLDNFDLEDAVRVVGAYSFGASRFGRGSEALPAVEAFANSLESRATNGETIDPRLMAIALNAWQRLLNSVQDYDQALRVGRRVLDLDPDNLSFIYNHSLNAMEAGDAELQVSMVDRYIELLRLVDFADADDDHLTHALRTYHLAGRRADALEVYAVLQAQFPYAADLVRADQSVHDLFDSPE